MQIVVFSLPDLKSQVSEQRDAITFSHLQAPFIVEKSVENEEEDEAQK
jgi:hypothetical protein